MSVTATVTNISRGSLHDGPGIRTVVYLKGCGMHCRWCHNPETLSACPEVLYNETRCIRCGRCLTVCPTHHKVLGDRMVFSREGCTGCGRCSTVCPGGALSLCGETRTVEEVFSEVQKDKAFYAESMGGVTVSGGECLLWPEFTAALCRLCREDHISTAIETALGVSWENARQVLPFTDLVYADLKLSTAEGYRQYTGTDGGRIFENLQKLTESGTHTCVRIPLIPGVNDSREELGRLGERILRLGKDLQGVELLRYNPLGEGKYIASGRSFTDFGGIQSDGEMERAAMLLQKAVSGRCPVSFS